MNKIIINIDVPNLEAGVAFYTSGLDFELSRTLFQRSVAELVLSDTVVYLIEQAEGTKPFPAANSHRTFRRHWTPVHLDVVVGDMAVAVAKALAAGAVQSGESTSHVWGILTPLADPFGHGICLLEFTKEGYDSVADVELEVWGE